MGLEVLYFFLAEKWSFVLLILTYCFLIEVLIKLRKMLLMENLFDVRLGNCLRGQGGGVPWVQIMENEFECLVVGGGDGGHF